MMRWNQIYSVVILGVAIAVSGCDENYEVTPASPSTSEGVTVEIDTDGVSTDDRVERRQERRENIREAIDEVDVNVGAGGVDVNVGDGPSGTNVRVD